MQKIVQLLLILCICTGCVSELKKEDNKQYKEIKVSDDAYFIAGKTLKISNENSNGENKKSQYIVKDEMELVQVLQYEIEEGSKSVFYKCEDKIDLQRVAEMLSVLNPFDISLSQTIIQTKNKNMEVIDYLYELEVQVLNDQYLDSLAFAKKKVRELFPDYMTTFDKIKTIHNYLVNEVTYDIETQNNSSQEGESFQASGAFFKHSAVCTGYSRAFMMLAKEARIPVALIVSERMNHSWNYVFDGEMWQYVDVTWDDPLPENNEKVSEQFLNLKKEEFMKEGSHVLSLEEITYFNNIVENIFFVK